MYSKFNVILIFFIAILLISCAKEKDPMYIHPSFSIVKEDFVARSTNHLAFPDLIRYNNRWFVVYREGDEHVYKKFSKIIVKHSVDFQNWIKLQEFEIPHWDLRDPKFSYDSLNNNIYLHFYGRNVNNSFFENACYYSEFTDSTGFFDIPKTLKRSGGKWSIDWLWRPLWHEGNLISHGYYHTGIRTHVFSNLDVPSTIVSEIDNNGWSEGASAIKGDSIFSVIRTQSLAKFAYASLKNFKYDYMNLPLINFGGPNIKIYKKGKFFIAGRVGNRFNIYLFEPNNQNLDLIYSYISFNEDNAYNGMVYYNKKLYIVHYYQESSGDFFIKNLVLDLANYE